MRITTTLLASLLIAISAVAAEDVLIADFEASDYGDWTVEGEAFGNGPARGAFAGQMKVEGYQGRRLVNSFKGGDDATGKLTSPAFTIERDYLNFLIGGGGYAGETCMNLLVDGAVVRTATGPNTQPGGSEALGWHTWDVSDLKGQEARIEIVDARTGGWGHINVDHLYLSDHKALTTKTREFVAEERYLNFPVDRDAPMREVFLRSGDTLRYFDIRLTDGEADYWVYMILEDFKGETITLEAEMPHLQASDLFAKVYQDESFPGEAELYEEALRPRYHFSTKRGWINDPNGLVFYDGTYHLFYQHNPFDWAWGNMHWGHATSTDLVHWTEQGDVFHPDELGTIYSGSAVVDWNNDSGLKAGDHPPLLAFYTSAGDHAPDPVPYTQSLGYSTDGGKTWEKYAGNPVLGHLRDANRDPKVIWHEGSEQWLMPLYLAGNDFVIYTSTDLVNWEKLCDVEMPDTAECPDFFPLTVDGQEKWIFWGANGNYLVGDFDGKCFEPTQGMRRLYGGGNAYAAQTYSDIPKEDGRRIQFAWMRQAAPDMPFNQFMAFPVELTLHQDGEEFAMHAAPVREIEKLHGETRAWENLVWTKVDGFLANLEADALHIEATITVEDGKRGGLEVRGVPVVYDRGEGTFTCGNHTVPVPGNPETISMTVLLDRLSLEVFANQGRIYVPMGVNFDADQRGVKTVGEAMFDNIAVHVMASAWK